LKIQIIIIFSSTPVSFEWSFSIRVFQICCENRNRRHLSSHWIWRICRCLVNWCRGRACVCVLRLSANFCAWSSLAVPTLFENDDPFVISENFRRLPYVF
jgi:hypothetical protein